jgi:hypothetical protein
LRKAPAHFGQRPRASTGLTGLRAIAAMNCVAVMPSTALER